MSKQIGNCDGVICCIGCMSLIPGLVKRVVNQVAFFPPRPAGYYISDQKQVFLVTDFESCQLEPLPDLTHEGVQVDTVRMQTRKGNVTYGFHFRRADSDMTILFSHGNSTDIGIMFLHLRDICVKLKVDVFAYEYSGYGQSTGMPSEKNLYADIDAAYHYLTHECGLFPSQIVCYGQSVGSAPTLDLTVRQPVGGVILHSALKSGLGVIHDVKTTHWFDVFQNIVKIRKVKCPVFVLHGTADSEVPLEHGVALFDSIPPEMAFDPWWVQEGGHNDIEIVWRSMFFLRLQNFLDAIRQGWRGIGHDENMPANAPVQGQMMGGGDNGGYYKRNNEYEGQRHPLLEQGQTPTQFPPPAYSPQPMYPPQPGDYRRLPLPHQGGSFTHKI